MEFRKLVFIYFFNDEAYLGGWNYENLKRLYLLIESESKKMLKNCFFCLKEPFLKIMTHLV